MGVHNVFVSAVGMGEAVQVRYALSKAVPDFAFFLASEQSLRVAQELVREAVSLADNAWGYYLAQPLDLKSCYKAAGELFAETRRQFPDAWIKVDLTAGTKPMAMALLLRANQLGRKDKKIELTYVTKEESRPDGMSLLYVSKLGGG
jgi:hypothetical protein